jgi:hypothetical protein
MPVTDTCTTDMKEVNGHGNYGVVASEERLKALESALPRQQAPEGLHLIHDFISPEEESTLITQIDCYPWCGAGIPPNPELLRRTMQFGYLFIYRTRSIAGPTIPLPDWTSPLIARLRCEGYFDVEPNHLLVNEYNVGQGYG